MPRLSRIPGLEDYQPLRLLGRGGMGAVYEVRHARSGRRCALKLVSDARGDSAALERARARFAREAELSARLSHPGVLKVLGASFDGPTPYLLADLLPGGSLAERIEREGRLPLSEALALGLGLCRALQHAHSLGVVHRDLKPENVLFDEGGAPVLVDFGVAVSLNPDTLRMTRPGELIGTPAFMSPEQAIGVNSDAPATDAYALGGLLYAMLLGRAPLELEECGSLAEVLARITAQRPLPPRAERREVPAALDALVLGLLSKEPAERPELALVEQTLADLSAPLALAAAGPRVPPLLLALGLCALAGALGALWGARRAGGGAGAPALGPSAQAGGDPGASPAGGVASRGEVEARIAAARRLRAEEAPYEQVWALLRGDAPQLVRERMVLAVARACWADARSLTRAHDQHPAYGRELRLLRAWASTSDERPQEAAELLRALSAEDDRWGYLARSLLPDPPPGLSALLAAERGCPWAIGRRYVLAPSPAARAAVAEEARELLASEPDVITLLGCLAAQADESGQEAKVRALLAHVRRLASGEQPPLMLLSLERALALRARDHGRAFALLQEIARRRPGRANVPLALGFELRGDLPAARQAAREGLRGRRESFLARLRELPVARSLRVLRYAGATVLSTQALPPAAREEIERRVAWVPPALRERARGVVRGALEGLPWWELQARVRALRGELGADRRWLELEFALQASRLRLEQVDELARRLEAGAPPAEAAEWRLLSVFARFDREGPSVLPRFVDVAEAFPGTGAATLARCVLRVEQEPGPVLELLRQVQAEASAPRCELVVAGVTFKAMGNSASGLQTGEQIARYGRPHFVRCGFLWPQIAEFCLLPPAAVELHYPTPRPAAIAEALRQLELLNAVKPTCNGFALAARLALRLPRGDPWRESVEPWLQAARERVALTPAAQRHGARVQVALATGSAALVAGRSQSEVVASWSEVPRGAFAPWERALFLRRFPPGRAEESRR